MSDTAAPEVFSSEAAMRPHTGGVQHARLLLISPDPHASEALRAELTLAGYEARCAPDLASALAFVQAQPPDLALIGLCKKHNFGRTAASQMAQALQEAADGAYLATLALTETPAEAEEDWTANGVDDALFWTAGGSPLLGLRVETLLHMQRRYHALRDSMAEMEATCAAAQQAAARFEAVFQQNSEAMLLVGGEGYIAGANECACALLGGEPDALIGLPLASLCPPELAWADALRTQGASHSFSDRDTALRTPSGQVIAAEVRASPVQPAFPPGADAKHNASTLRVVTLHDRRPQQARLAEAQRAASAETEAALRREINNPLFLISSNVELLQSALQTEDSGVQAKLARIADAIGRLAQMPMPLPPDTSPPKL